jgi:TolB protein
VALAVGVAALAGSAGARAAFPGENGKLAFASNRSGQNEIVVANADGSNRVDLGAQGTSPKWSPDGTRIAFSSFRDGNSEIYVMNADGSGQTRLTFNTTYDSRPQWTADGTHLVFTRIVDGNWEIFRMNADGSDQVDLTSDPALDWGQATSPHGKKIAFTRVEDGVGHLFVMTDDGKALQRLTATAAYDSYPNWSPRGNQILFQRDQAPTTDAGNTDLWVLGPNGSETQLTHKGGTEYILNASWSPDGTRIVYTSCGLLPSSPCNLHVMNADGSGDVEISTPRTPFLDTFTGNSLDSVWGSPFVTGGGVSITQANDELEISVPSSATLDPSFGYISITLAAQCRLVGDFDVQVDYRLLSGQLPESSVNVSLGTASPDYSVFHGLFVFNPGGGTSISTGFPDPVNTFVRAPETSSSLRLTRVGSTWSAYRLVNGAWELLQATPGGTTADQLANLNVFSNAAPFSHPDVKVAYDNFRVASGTFSCPTWWSDSNADWQPVGR